MPHPSLLIALLLGLPVQAAGFQTTGGCFFKDNALYGAEQDDLFGSSVAYLGDINGDFIGDFAVGIPGYDSLTYANSGAVRLYSGADFSTIHTFEGDQFFASIGTKVLALPDLDGDTIPDLAWSSQAGDGSVTVVSTATLLPIHTFAAPLDAHGFGCSLSTIADLNADAIPELIVGAKTAVTGGVSTGSVYIYDLSSGASLRAHSGASLGDDFGTTLQAMEDVDLDGYQDYLVAAPGADPNGLPNAGSIFLYSGLTGIQLLQVDGSESNERLGSALLGLEDLDGDALPDFAIGNSFDSPSGPGLQVGSVTFISSATGIALSKFTGQDLYEEFGATLASAGDIDGDGFEDILIGAPGSAYGGRVYVFSAVHGAEITKLESDESAEGFGIAACNMGDFNLDGEPDLLLSASYSNVAADRAGAVFVCGLRPCITSSHSEFSSAVGESVTFTMEFPMDYWQTPTQSYQLLASVSGTGPQSLLGMLVPLTNDSVYRDTLAQKYPAWVTTPYGDLAPDGTATTTMVIPSGALSGMAGGSITLSAARFENSGAGLVIHGFTRPIDLLILP